MLTASAASRSVFDSSRTLLPRHCTATVSLSSRCDTALLGLIRPTTQLWRWLAKSRHLKLLSPMNLAVVDSTASKSTVGMVKTPLEHPAISGGGVCGKAVGKSHEGAVGQLGHGLAVGQVVGGGVVVRGGGGVGKRFAGYISIMKLKPSNTVTSHLFETHRISRSRSGWQQPQPASILGRVSANSRPEAVRRPSFCVMCHSAGRYF